MEIREIKSSDAGAFIKFYEQLVKETDNLLPSSEEIKVWEKSEEKVITSYGDYKQVFIALEGDKIVGYLGLKRSHLLKIRHVADFTVGILEGYKRRKIATQLIKFAENWAKQKDIKRMTLKVSEDNIPAISLFKKMGFLLEGTLKHSVNKNGKFYDSFMMAQAI